MNSSALSPHAVANRAYWTQMSETWVESGRKAWQAEEINWGIWATPESQVQALGNLDRWDGCDVVELGCGTGYVSAWLARLGARPIGIDVTRAQLTTARNFQKEFSLEFPLIEASAENVPLSDGTFDLAISEYGASIWCDPYRWIPEASRLLKPGGELIFLRNSTIATLCMPSSGPASPALARDYFGLYRLEWQDEPGIEFHLPTGPMLQCLRNNGFVLDKFMEIAPPPDAVENRFEYISLDWSRHWPAEEIWSARKALR